MVNNKNPFTVSIFSLQDVHPMHVAASVSGQTLHAIPDAYSNPLGAEEQRATFSPPRRLSVVAWSDLAIPSKEEHKVPHWLQLSGRSSKSGAENAKKTIRSTLWHRVYFREAKRKDAQFARLFELDCPKELTSEQIHPIACSFAAHLAKQGMVVDFALHQGVPNEQGHCDNTVQMLTTLRTLESGTRGFGNKNRSWNERSTLLQWRAQWFECLKECLPLLPQNSQVQWNKKIQRFTKIKKDEPSSVVTTEVVVTAPPVPKPEIQEFAPTDKLQRILRL